MGMVQFMSEVDNGELTDNNYSFTLTAAPDEVSAALMGSGFLTGRMAAEHDGRGTEDHIGTIIKARTPGAARKNAAPGILC